MTPRTRRAATAPSVPAPALSSRPAVASWRPALLVAAGALAFATSLGTPFFLDDGEAIERNPHITALTPLSRALAAPPQSAVSGRPLVSLSLAINYAIGGLNPSGYHLANLILHLGAGLLLWGIVRRTLRSGRLPAALSRDAEGLALVVALLWLVHPLHTEVIAYVVARTESMMAACYLLTLYAAIRSEGGGSGWPVVAVIACALGAAAKESIVTAPLMVLLYDVVFVSGSFREAGRRRGWMYAGLLASWGILAALHWDTPRFRSAGFETGLSSWTYLLTQAPMIVRYLRLTVWPSPLVADYGITTPTTPAAVWPDMALVTALVIVTMVLWRRHRVPAFVATWFFATLAPASSVVPIATEVGAERRMYLPLAALIVGLVMGARALAVRIPTGTWKPAVVATAALVSVALVSVSAARGLDYRDPVRIWEVTVRDRPHARAQHNLGIALAGQGRLDEAIARYRLAAETLPEARYALGFALLTRQDNEAAIAEFREFLARAPDDAMAPQAATLLGTLLLQRGDAAGAVEAFERALAMRSPDAAARKGLASALTALAAELASQGRPAAATDVFARAAAASPDAPGAQLNLGTSLMQLGRGAEGERAFRRGLAIAPDHLPLRNALAAALATRGASGEARAEFERVLAVDPGNAEANAGLAILARRLQGASPPR